MGHSDQMLARYAAEIEERSQFLDSVVEKAQNEERDLDEKELELVTETRSRIGRVNELMKPLEEARHIAGESAHRIAEIARYMEGKPKPAEQVEYRSAGAYALDYWKAGLGVEEARQRLDLFNRAAAHQTTGDNPGLLPQQVLGPVINFVDTARPLVNALGPRQLPSGTWQRPKVSQHTDVAPQSAEKAELVSRKMIIGMVPVTAKTYGGYVNVSRQNIDWSQPAIMDIVINDLAGVYAEETEQALAVAIDGATTAGPVIPTGPTTGDAVAAAIWTAVGSSFAAMKGAGRTIVAVSPDMLGLVGPLFPPVNPGNAQSPGFSAGDFASGGQGSISGLQVVMSPGLDAGSMIVLNSAAVEVYEDRIGALQVVEPSVLGVQVAYAGYFAPLVIEPLGIIEITKTP
jgi:HK97 family phage major capsid protein